MDDRGLIAKDRQVMDNVNMHGRDCLPSTQVFVVKFCCIHTLSAVQNGQTNFFLFIFLENM